jgi:gliding-associated putative ABC transporter substrate-binding component GldG
MNRKKNLSITIALMAGILIMVNLLSSELHFRLDLTEGGQYTLSRATRDILHDLHDPVTIKAYFSKNLPPNIEKTRKDFRDLLIEYANRAPGMIQYSFADPNANEETEQDAQQKGIRPVLIDVREKDQMQQRKAYLGATLSLGDKQEVIPFLQPGSAMEYALSTAIKKLSVTNKPVVGIIQGQGEPAPAELGQLSQQLEILYQPQPVSLTDSTEIPANIRTLVMIRPTDSLRPREQEKLDSFLAHGGRLAIAFNRMQGDMQMGQARSVNGALAAWLAKKGVIVGNNAIIDAQCGTVPVQQRAGFFTLQANVQLPYLPMISNFADHPITAGLENVVLEFPSSIRYSGPAAVHYTPLAFTSAVSDTQSAPVLINVDRRWTQNDFHHGHLAVAAALDGPIEKGGAATKLVVVSDGNFVVNGPAQQGGGRELTPDNVNLFSNAIDWLTDNTGLIGLRTKAVTSRPLTETSDGEKALIKYFNFLVPILLAVLYGLYRARRNRNIRMARMHERYTQNA